MTKKDIIDAYVRIRTIDNTIPDDVLDYMKDAALFRLEMDDADAKAKEFLAYCIEQFPERETQLKLAYYRDMKRKMKINRDQYENRS